MDKNKTLYVADDDDDDRFLLKAAIKETGENVKVVETDAGEDLIDELKKADDLSNAVAVVDMNMPGMDGLQTIEAIKSDPEISEVSTVMMSTSSSETLEKKAMAAGADHFVPKPTSFKLLIDIIKKIFSLFFGRK